MKIQAQYEIVPGGDFPVVSAENVGVGEKKLDEVINGLSTYVTPQMFGAKGDGVNDDSWLIGKTLEYAKENNCALYFPKGTYLVANIAVWDGAVLIGEDMNSTIIKQKSTASGNIVYNSSNEDGTYTTNNVTIKNLTFDGYDVEKGASGILYKGFRLYLESVTVRGFNQYGIKIIRGDGDYAGKHGHMKDIMLYDNRQGNMLYDGETDNNIYNIMAYHNEGIEPEFNVKMLSAGCRIFGMHLWGNADVSLWSDCFGATYTGCHIEGGKSAKIAVYDRLQFYGEIYHHDAEASNTVPAIKFMDSVYNSTFIVDCNLIYALVDLNNKWHANTRIIANAEMISDNLFLNGSFGVKDNISVCWGYNGNRYVYIVDNKRNVNTYKNIDSVYHTINESHYNGSSKIFSINAGNGTTTDHIAVIPDNGKAHVSVAGTSENIDLVLSPKGYGTVEIKHTCRTGGDYNELNKTGFYEMLGTTDNPTLNSPNGLDTNNNHCVIVQKRSDTYFTQTAYSVRSDAKVYHRVCSNGNFTAWKQLIDSSMFVTTKNENNVYYGEDATTMYLNDGNIRFKTAKANITVTAENDLNECVDPSVMYINYVGTKDGVPANSPVVSPYRMYCYYTRQHVLVQVLLPDIEAYLGSIYFRRRTGADETTHAWTSWSTDNTKMNAKHKCVEGADYNSFTETGFYEALGRPETPTQNAPDGTDTYNNFYVIVQKRDDNYCAQTAFSTRIDTGIYHRVRSNGTFLPWKRIAYGDEVSELSANLATQTARIDALSKVDGSTDGNAELIDIRTGYDGTVYDNAGTAVRTQIQNLKADIEAMATMFNLTEE